MRIYLDTVNKHIKLEQTTNFADFVNFITELLPTTWKEYNIEAGNIINWFTTPYITTYDLYTPGNIPYTISCTTSHTTTNTTADAGMHGGNIDIEKLNGTYTINTELSV